MSILKKFLHKLIDMKIKSGITPRHTFIGFNFTSLIIACVVLFIASDYMRSFTLGMENFNNLSSVLAFLVFVTSLIGICMGEVKSPPIFGLILYLTVITALTVGQIVILFEYIAQKLDIVEHEEVTMRTYYTVIQDDSNDYAERIEYDSRDIEVAGASEKIDVGIIAVISALITVQVRKNGGFMGRILMENDCLDFFV